MKQNEDTIRPGSMTLGSGTRQVPVRGTVHSDVWIPLLQALASAMLVGLFAVGVALAASGQLWGGVLAATTMPAGIVWLWRMKGLQSVVWERERWHAEQPVMQQPAAPAERFAAAAPRLVAVSKEFANDDDREDANWGKFVWLGFTHGLNFHADSRGVGGLEGRVLPSGEKITYGLWGQYRSELERVGLVHKDGRGKAVFTYGYDETLDRLQVRDKWRLPAPRAAGAAATDDTDD